MKDAIAIHERVCPNCVRSLRLSSDGVQECRSNSVSLDVYSIKMENCRNVYPLKIIRPLNKFHVDYRPHLKEILDGLVETNSELKCLTADNPKRSNLKEVRNHASPFGCEYCTCKGERYIDKSSKIKEEIKKNELRITKFQKEIHELRNTPGTSAALKTQDQQIEVLNQLICELKNANVKMSKCHNHPVWPHTTMNAPKRTKEDIIEIVNLLEQEDRPEMTADDVKGVVGRSLLLDLPDFDFVLAVPAEYMHLGCLGVVKR